MSGFFHKCPVRELNLRLDFRQAGLGSEEKIVGDEGWSIHPDQQTRTSLKVISAMIAGTVAQACLIGGDPGQTYFATAHIRTDLGRSLKRTVVVRVSNNKELTR